MKLLQAHQFDTRHSPHHPEEDEDDDEEEQDEQEVAQQNEVGAGDFSEQDQMSNVAPSST